MGRVWTQLDSPRTFDAPPRALRRSWIRPSSGRPSRTPAGTGPRSGTMLRAHLEAETAPLSRIMTCGDDKAGRQTVRVDQENRRTGYLYEDVGRATSRPHQHGSRSSLTRRVSDVGLVWRSIKGDT
jgi:hypothetical protein